MLLCSWQSYIKETTTTTTTLRKCPYDHRLTNKAYLSAVTVTNIFRSFYLQDGGKNQLALTVSECCLIKLLPYKNVKSCFWILKKRTYSFRGLLITPVFNTQWPKVSTGKRPTSNILLCNNISVITQLSAPEVTTLWRYTNLLIIIIIIINISFQKPVVWKY